MRNLGPTVAESILQDRRDIPFDDKISMLLPEQNPFLTLSSRLNKRPVTEKEFSWFEEYPDAHRFALAAGPDASGTSINLGTGNGRFVRAGDLLKIVGIDGTDLLEEQVLVTAVATDTVTVTRAYGENVAQDFSGGAAEVFVLGNLSEEGAPSTVIRSSDVVKVYNYTSIIRTGMKISKTADGAKQKANPQERMREHKHQGIEHALRIENRIWFGERKQDVTGTAVKQVSRGILEFIQTNRMWMSATPAWADLVKFAETLFQYGSGTRYLFCGPKFLSWLDELSEGKLQLKPGDDTYGVPIADLETSHGRLRIVRNRLFTGNVYGGMAVAIDMDGKDTASYRPFAGRDTTLRVNIQNPEADYILDEYLTEFGVQLKQDKLHGILMMRGS